LKVTLGGFHGHSWRFGENKHFLHLPGIEPRFLTYRTRSLIKVPTEPPLLYLRFLRGGFYSFLFRWRNMAPGLRDLTLLIVPLRVTAKRVPG
jgi:hypothetical protein